MGEGAGRQGGSAEGDDDGRTVISDLLAQLEVLNRSRAGPFPYEGCRRLRAAVGERHEGLIPDLDLYLSEFAGYRSWGKRILTWSDEKIATVEKRLSQSFFDRFPSYAELKPMLDVTDASDVRRALGKADRTREVLLQLVLAIRRSRAGIAL
jgi:hypothetical protein